MKVTLKGKYKVGIERHGECAYETDWFDNLITDRGMDLFGESFSNKCWVGSGTAAPTCADTGLQFPYGFYAGKHHEANFYDQWEDGVNYSSEQNTYRFEIGQIHGPVSEVGIGPQSNDLFSRSLLPSTLLLDGDVDRLYVIYELRLCIPQESQFFDLVINGTTHSCESYPVGTDGDYWSVEIGGRIWTLGHRKFSSQQPFAAYQDQEDNNHVEMGNGDRQDYVPGSFQLLREGISLGPGVTDTFTRLRLGCGWGNVWGIHYTNGGVYDVLVDPPIVIEDHQRLLITAGISWEACGDGCAGDPAGTYPPGETSDPDYGTGGGDTGGGDTGGGDTGGTEPAEMTHWHDVEFRMMHDRLEVGVISTDTSDEYVKIVANSGSEGVLYRESKYRDPTNDLTGSTGVAAEFVRNTECGYLLRFYKDSTTEGFSAKIVVERRDIDCNGVWGNAVMQQYPLVDGGAESASPKCSSPNLSTPDSSTARFYLFMTDSLSVDISSTDTGGATLGLFSTSFGDDIPKYDVERQLELRSDETGVKGRFVDDVPDGRIHCGYIIEWYIVSDTRPFSATISGNIAEYDAASDSWVDVPFTRQICSDDSCTGGGGTGTGGGTGLAEMTYWHDVEFTATRHNVELGVTSTETGDAYTQIMREGAFTGSLYTYASFTNATNDLSASTGVAAEFIRWTECGYIIRFYNVETAVGFTATMTLTDSDLNCGGGWSDEVTKQYTLVEGGTQTLVSKCNPSLSTPDGSTARLYLHYSMAFGFSISSTDSGDTDIHGRGNTQYTVPRKASDVAETLSHTEGDTGVAGRVVEPVDPDGRIKCGYLVEWYITSSTRPFSATITGNLAEYDAATDLWVDVPFTKTISAD